MGYAGSYRRKEDRNTVMVYSTPGKNFNSCQQGKAGGIFTQDLPFKKYIPDFNALPFGAIIGSVCIELILKTEDFDLSDSAMNALTLEEKAFGDYSSGRYGWKLSDPIQFKKPIPARGMPGLWSYKNESGIILCQADT